MAREQTTIRLPTELKEQLQREADKRGMPVKDLVMFILKGYMDHPQNAHHHPEDLDGRGHQDNSR